MVEKRGFLYPRRLSGDLATYGWILIAFGFRHITQRFSVDFSSRQNISIAYFNLITERI